MKTLKAGRLHKSHVTGKPILSDHSKIGKMKALKTGGSLMQIKSIVECSLLTCIKLLKVLKTNFEWLLRYEIKKSL